MTGINFALAQPGSISGTITDTLSAFIASVQVRAYNADGSTAGVAATTNASGQYTLSNLATGRYFVRTTNSAGYVDQLYAGRACPNGSCSVSTGTPVTVTAGATTSGTDFVLSSGGTIRGTVTRGGAPLAGATVSASTRTSSLVGGSATTDASGQYTITGLPPGTFFLLAQSSSTESQIFSGIPCPTGSCDVYAGTPVVVAAGATVSAIDFALTTAASISGTVTDATTGTGLSSVYVSAYSSELGYGTGQYTGAFGTYTLGHLPAGRYTITTSNTYGYVDQKYRGVACPPSTCTATGTPVVVTTGEAATGIDFALVQGATITGIVSDEVTGNGIPAITVAVYDRNRVEHVLDLDRLRRGSTRSADSRPAPTSSERSLATSISIGSTRASTVGQLASSLPGRQ